MAAEQQAGCHLEAAVAGTLNERAHKELCGTALELEKANVGRLASLPADAQWQIARRCVRLGEDFGKAIEHQERMVPTVEVQANVASNPFEGLATSVVTRHVQPAIQRQTRRVRLHDLRPNLLNGNIWNESLSEESIARLAEDIRRRGLRQMIEVNEVNDILDGERRWRALMLLDPEQEIEVVVIADASSSEQIEDYIHDSRAPNRHKSIAEKVAFYELSLRVLQRRHGRAQGRPGKDPQDEDLYWPASKVREEAARRAGLSSAETARRAGKVLVEGAESIRKGLVDGELSVNGAYGLLAKVQRPEAPGAASSGRSVPPVDATRSQSNVASNPFADDSVNEEVSQAGDGASGQGPVDDDDDEAVVVPADDEGTAATPADQDDREADVDVDPWDALDEATSTVHERFEQLLALDRDRALAWHEAHLEGMRDLVVSSESEDAGSAGAGQSLADEFDALVASL